MLNAVKSTFGGKQSTALLLFVLLFINFFPNSIHSQNGPLKDKFYLGAFQFSMYPPWFYNSLQLGRHTTLSYNMMHTYGFQYENDPGTIESERYYGGFDDPLTDYDLNLNSLLSAWNGAQTDNHNLILERTKILRPGYGQRSTYQAEYTSSQLTGGSIRPGYGFTTYNGQPYTETWQNETVSGRKMCVNCPGDNPPAGYIVKDLYENREQVNVSGQVNWNSNTKDMLYNHSDRKDPDYTWYVKPRMRIGESDAENSTVKRVVRVEVYNFSGDLIDSNTIFTLNFQDGSGNYNGGPYKEIFNYTASEYPLLFKAEDMLEGTLADDLRGITTNVSSSQVDYRVYWYGDVDVWLDYVRVDDKWAHFLFEPDPTLIYDFVAKIDEEVEFFETKDEFGYFYIDEHYYNNYPCISKVNDIIQAENANTSMLVLFNSNYFLNFDNLKNPPVDDSYEFLYDMGVVRDVIMPDIYPFETAVSCPLPENLDNSWPSIPSTRYYHSADTRDIYNDSVISNLDNGMKLEQNSSFITMPYLERYKKCAELTKAHPEVAFHLNLQAHSYANSLSIRLDAPNTREPTMEEISLQAYLGLCYNAKNISQWIYQSGSITSGLGKFYDYGILDTDLNYVREYNYYGQEKWNGLVALNQKIRAMGDYMFTTHNLQWDAGLTVHNETMPFKYIENIKSRATLINGINPCFHDSPPNEYYDCDEKRYWEIGFYNPEFLTGPEKYFIALNKRCTPNKNNDGDLRELQIKFLPSQLPVYNSWKLVDALSNTVIQTFDKNSPQYIIAGTFNPGEGKLFKLEPVPVKGGTLVADEVISGQTFTCEDTVISNGYNITINGGSTISFTDSATIIMNGGTFQSGALKSNSKLIC